MPKGAIREQFGVEGDPSQRRTAGGVSCKLEEFYRVDDAFIANQFPLTRFVKMQCRENLLALRVDKRGGELDIPGSMIGENDEARNRENWLGINLGPCLGCGEADSHSRERAGTGCNSVSC